MSTAHPCAVEASFHSATAMKSWRRVAYRFQSGTGGVEEFWKDKSIRRAWTAPEHPKQGVNGSCQRSGASERPVGRAVPGAEKSHIRDHPPRSFSDGLVEYEAFSSAQFGT